MLLIMIVRKSLKDCFGDMKTCSAGAGIMGLMVRITAIFDYGL